MGTGYSRRTRFVVTDLSMPRCNEIDAGVTTRADAVIFDPNCAHEDRKQHHGSDNEAALHETTVGAAIRDVKGVQRNGPPDSHPSRRSCSASRKAA